MKKLFLILLIISGCCKEKVEPYNPLKNTKWYYNYNLCLTDDIYENIYTFTKDSLIVEYYSYENDSLFILNKPYWYCYTIREYTVISRNKYEINSYLSIYYFKVYNDSLIDGIDGFENVSSITLFKNKYYKQKL